MVTDALTDQTSPARLQSQQVGLHRMQGRCLAPFIKRLVCAAIKNDRHLSFSVFLTARRRKDPGSERNREMGVNWRADFDSLKKPISA
jgi:hypothetical protein